MGLQGLKRIAADATLSTWSLACLLVEPRTEVRPATCKTGRIRMLVCLHSISIDGLAHGDSFKFNGLPDARHPINTFRMKAPSLHYNNTPFCRGIQWQEGAVETHFEQGFSIIPVAQKLKAVNFLTSLRKFFDYREVAHYQKTYSCVVFLCVFYCRTARHCIMIYPSHIVFPACISKY
ncbi:hypothetical protein B0H11DRAFT_691014 [Mycena galericulata]|nr:hypothetical protein B0H11DRAFT_691014 [Mycena galericulata]